MQRLIALQANMLVNDLKKFFANHDFCYIFCFHLNGLGCLLLWSAKHVLKIYKNFKTYISPVMSKRHKNTYSMQEPVISSSYT